MIHNFNNFLLDTVKFTLTKESERVPVEPQVFNIILYLIEQKDRVVSRAELLDVIWKDKVVSDSSINNHIKTARKVLDDDGIKQSVIKTVHGRGYQFIATITAADDTTVVEQNVNITKNFYRKLVYFSVLLLMFVFGFKYYQKVQLHQSVQRIANYQTVTKATFIAQVKRRNELVAMIEGRIGEQREMQFEKYFSYYFKQLNDQERFVFDQIRAMTDNGLYQNNFKILEELNKYPEILRQIKGTKELKQHLIFWINKYDSVFAKRQDMCLLYVGVEDGVPYPSRVNENINAWLGYESNHTNEKYE